MTVPIEIVRNVEVVRLYPEATWGYMVKRLSAHGGCLGGQRR